jgi:hypothetical protein
VGKQMRWSRGGRHGAAGVDEIGGARGPPACHLAVIAGVWRPHGGRALTVVEHGVQVGRAGVGLRCGRLRPWAEKGGGGSLGKIKCFFYLFLNHSAQKC